MAPDIFVPKTPKFVDFDDKSRENERLISAEPISEEKKDEEITSEFLSLRPTSLAEFVGQERIKKELTIAIEAAKQRADHLEHVLLYGNPGLGKTTLAHIIAREIGANMKITSGPALERVGDLAAILTNLQTGDVLFIDEIHRMNRTVEEVLYSAMEDYALDIIVGKGPAARTLRMPLERFSIVGATTKLNLLSAPLRDRFGHVFHLNFYEDADMEKIVERNSALLQVTIDAYAIGDIAKRSRRTPRVANRLLKRTRDYAQVSFNGIISKPAVEETFALLDIDFFGLDQIDRKLLEAIIDIFRGGPVGLSTLAASIAEETETIEQVYEPYLLQIGMLERTLRGRKATKKAYEHLGKKFPGLLD